MNPSTTGVIADNRSAEEKEFDTKHEELFTSSAPVLYMSKADASKYVGAFPIDDQKGTSSCVPHGKVLATSIFRHIQTGEPFVQESSMFIYRQRSNYPGEGMNAVNANLLTENGAPIFADLPTPDTEAEANALSVAGLAGVKTVGCHWVNVVDPTNFDTLAYISNSLGLPITILIYATADEWDSDTITVKYPGLMQSDPRAIVRHCVTVLPASGYKDAHGGEWIIIQDSAGFGGTFFRSVSANFLSQRCYGADYPITLDAVKPQMHPAYVFNNDLTVGSTGADVTALQVCLQYFGYFPNCVNGKVFQPTGYYGGLTKTAVLSFQTAYQLPATGYTGPITRGKLNHMVR